MSASPQTIEADIPFSHKIAADTAGVEVEKLTITASPEENKALAAHLNIQSLEGLRADIKLERIRGGRVIHVSGVVRGSIEQICVKSLEPFQTELSEAFEAWYADPEQAVSFQKAKQKKELERQQGEAPMIAEEDEPEPIQDGMLDLGDTVRQFLSLAIDPYPVNPEVLNKAAEERSEHVIHQEEDITDKNPFAALKDWKRKLEE
jgi:uncharacterized metal-binding protein YceD (DUF177 family)